MASHTPLALCVDDEPIILTALSNQLRRYFGNALTIETANSGEEALEILEELLKEGRDIEVIVSDQMMPGIKGDEFLTQAHVRSPHSVKILLTGFANIEAIGNAINHANLYRYMGKPWQESDLGLTIREAINVFWKEKTIQQQNEVLKKLNEELEQKVIDRTHELTLKNSALENAMAETLFAQRKLIQSEKMAALGQLVAGVAHEVNTPLGVIKASIGSMIKSYESILRDFSRLMRVLKARELILYLGLISSSSKTFLTSREERELRQRFKAWFIEKNLALSSTSAEYMVEMGLPDNLDRFMPIFSHAQAEFLIKTAHSTIMHEKNAENIKVAADKADKIIFALKSHSRINMSDEQVLLDLNANLETILTLYQSQIKQGVDIIKKYPQRVVHITGYPDELSQVWTNLIHNSLQAMNNSGELVIEIEDTDPEFVQVTVADNGPGIPAEIHDKIFTPFFTTKPAGEGSGLGLDITRKIVEKHQGKIEFNSTVGKGTSFFVFLKRTLN
jgi:two-component system, NtrC family, sensor kinase